jgi:hypothetical protein
MTVSVDEVSIQVSSASYDAYRVGCRDFSFFFFLPPNLPTRHLSFLFFSVFSFFFSLLVVVIGGGAV